MKSMTLRISSSQLIGLKFMAAVRGTSVNAEVREAIDSYIKARSRDPQFQERLQRRRAEQNAAFDKLANP